MSAAAHPLLAHFHRCARGVFPPADGGVTMLGVLPSGKNTVVCSTGHAFIATDAPDVLAGLHIDGFGSAHAPEVLLRLARGGTIDVIDLTLVAQGRSGGSTLSVSTDLDHHPRVRYSRTLRTDVVVHGDERGFVTIGTGMAGRTEMSIEIPDATRGAGVGRALIEDALGLVQPGTDVFAAVSPGNARSLRAFLSVGFVAIGSEVVITPGRAAELS
ncbi:MAG: hypothetical protein JWL72_4164 [Ilumatobacteraceae bacterium]|nr:hypothetical protein [Ilumatobacteraceae bacterium]MCU1390826.1 hypothetical protein [Ilumatobacteraceae bacterium]